MEVLFPFDEIREEQDRLVQKVFDCLENKKNLVVHAPTGLGKTVAALAPAISFAIKKGLTVFFLTSRHTQHKIAIETLKAIKAKFNLPMVASSIIGKQHMCLQPGAGAMRSSDFHEYCKAMREEKKCMFYQNVRDGNKLTVLGENVLDQAKGASPCDVEKIMELSGIKEVCPYEVAAALASKSLVVVTDYYYLFSPSIRNSFLKKTGKSLENSIVIVDEAHNLPDRLRRLVTHRLSTKIIKAAIREAEALKYEELSDGCRRLLQILEDLKSGNSEKIVKREEFTDAIRIHLDYEQITADLAFAGDEVLEKKKISALESIAKFLEAWNGSDVGFARILSVKPDNLILSYRCLDPSVIAMPVINESYCTIMMSGTLVPTDMYRNLLGFPDNTEEAVFKNPFPKKNRKILVIPETTTKFEERNEAQYKRIAEICADIANKTPGCSAIFFPSYDLRNSVYKYFSTLCMKTIFTEDSRASKQERSELLSNFASYKEAGAVLLGVASGSFGEGIDLPGILKAVVVVGLPLQTPDLEVQEMIKYYDSKFGRGRDYGYVLPAVTKALQNAGRCIRSQHDKGVMVFLDQRYAWPYYKRCFPADWQVDVSRDYGKLISEFFR